MPEQLFLQFSINDQRFAIATKTIAEITPMVELTRVPKTEPYIAGLYNYRGTMLPVIDVSKLLFDSEHDMRICTRILIMQNPSNLNIQNVGLIVEQANKTISCDTSKFTEHKLSENMADYVGQIIHDEQGEIQVVDIDKLIPAEQTNLQIAVNSN